MIVATLPEALMATLHVDKRPIKYFMQHHTYSPTGRKYGPSGVEISNNLFGESVDMWHRLPIKMEMQHGRMVNTGGRGWRYGLGYHILINPNGVLEVGDRWLKQLAGAHCKEDNMNINSLGISLIGNFDIDEVTDAQKQAWCVVHRTLSKAYGVALNSDTILLHRDYAFDPYPPKPGQKPYKTCPGNKITTETYLSWLNN